MKQYIILIIKGFFIGIGKIVPGVSGAIIAISLKVYDIGLDSLRYFFNDIKKNIFILSSLSIGLILSIMFFSKIISFLLKNYYFLTLLFFIGLIIGGMKNFITKNEKNKLIIITSFLIFISITFFTGNNIYIMKNNFLDFIVYFIGGFFEAIGTIVPGISATGLLLTLGIYETIINLVSNITNLSLVLLSLNILIPFILGIIFGGIITIIIINYLFINYKLFTYNCIYGICLATIFFLFIQTFSINYSIIELFIGIILLVIGIFLTVILQKNVK